MNDYFVGVLAVVFVAGIGALLMRRDTRRWLRWLVTCQWGLLGVPGLESGTWTGDLDSSGAGTRATGVVYRNTSGRKRRVTYNVSDSAGSIQVIAEVGTADPPTITVSRQVMVASGGLPGYFEVPNNWYYRITITTGTFNHWNELDE